MRRRSIELMQEEVVVTPTRIHNSVFGIAKKENSSKGCLSEVKGVPVLVWRSCGTLSQ